MVQSAYDAIHLNKVVGEYHEADVKEIIMDEDFNAAYNMIRRTKYIRLFSLKQRIILGIIHFRLEHLLKVLFTCYIRR